MTKDEYLKNIKGLMDLSLSYFEEISENGFLYKQEKEWLLSDSFDKGEIVIGGEFGIFNIFDGLTKELITGQIGEKINRSIVKTFNKNEKQIKNLEPVFYNFKQDTANIKRRVFEYRNSYVYLQIVHDENDALLEFRWKAIFKKGN